MNYLKSQRGKEESMSAMHFIGNHISWEELRSMITTTTRTRKYKFWIWRAEAVETARKYARRKTEV